MKGKQPFIHCPVSHNVGSYRDREHPTRQRTCPTVGQRCPFLPLSLPVSSFSPSQTQRIQLGGHIGSSPSYGVSQPCLKAHPLFSQLDHPPFPQILALPGRVGVSANPWAGLPASPTLKLFEKTPAPWNKPCVLDSREILIVISAFIVSLGALQKEN